jgi:hypothetical protein
MKKSLAIAVSALLLTGCAPLSLDSSTASDILFSKRDFSIDVTQPDEEIPISDAEQPVFNASKDCRPDSDLASLIADEGRLLASSDLISVGSSDAYIHQDVLEFETPGIAGEFLELVREGLADSDCEYNDDSDFSTFKTKYYDISNSNDFYSVGSDDSVVWLTDSIIKTKASSALNIDLSSDSLHTIVRQNNYVLVIKGTIYRDSEFRGSIRDLEDDFGIIVKQFVSGKKVST